MSDAQDCGEQRKKIGRLAEKEFSTWCTRADLTVNKSDEDDEGWDFFVQAKSSNSPRQFLDREMPALNAMVQVKATGDASGAVRVSLANALKLVKHGGPAFVFIAQVDGDDVSFTWLLHCWDAFISRVLEAAVVAESGRSLNERTLTFRPAVEDRVSKETLRARLEHLIGDVKTYNTRKSSLVESVGYGEARYIGRLRMPVEEGLDPNRRFGELLVGARAIDGVSLEIDERRFDVVRPFKRLENATITRSKVDGPSATLIFEGKDGRRAEIECVAHVASSYVPGLPDSANVTRLVAPYFEFISQEPVAERVRFDVRFPDLDAPIAPGKLQERAQVARVARFFQEGNVRVSVRVQDFETELHNDGDVHASAGPLPGAIDDLATLVHQFSIPLGSGTIGRGRRSRESAPYVSYERYGGRNRLLR